VWGIPGQISSPNRRGVPGFSPRPFKEGVTKRGGTGEDIKRGPLKKTLYIWLPRSYREPIPKREESFHWGRKKGGQYINKRPRRSTYIH